MFLSHIFAMHGRAGSELRPVNRTILQNDMRARQGENNREAREGESTEESAGKTREDARGARRVCGEEKADGQRDKPGPHLFSCFQRFLRRRCISEHYRRHNTQ